MVMLQNPKLPKNFESKLQVLTLTQGMDAMAYINKFLIYLRDLNKIPGEEFSASHGVSIFLRNIKDDDYQQEISILKTANEQNIMTCVQAIRKRERELIRIRAERRKLRTFPKRLRDEDLLSLHANKLRRVGDGKITGDIRLTAKGFIKLPSDQFRSLDDKSRNFVMNYNRQVRAGFQPPSLTPPNGANVIPSTPRLITTSPPSSVDPFTLSNPTSLDNPVPSPTQPKKRITFDISEPNESTESS